MPSGTRLLLPANGAGGGFVWMLSGMRPGLNYQQDEIVAQVIVAKRFFSRLPQHPAERLVRESAFSTFLRAARKRRHRRTGGLERGLVEEWRPVFSARRPFSLILEGANPKLGANSLKDEADFTSFFDCISCLRP